MSDPSLVVDLATRNAFRHWRRTLVLGSAVAIGVTLLLLLAAFVNGWGVSLEQRAIENLIGHARVEHRDYSDRPAAEFAFPVPRALEPALARDPYAAVDARAGAGTPALPGAAIARVRVPVVVRSEREVRGVQLVGTDPAREIAFSFLGAVRTQGILIRDPGDRGLLLGRALARDLGTGPGKRVVLLAQDRNGDAVEAGFTVTGLFDADRQGPERAFAFVGREAAQAFLGLGSRVTEISFRLPPGSGTDEAALVRRLRTVLGATGQAPGAASEGAAGAVPGPAASGDGAPLLVRSWREIDVHAATMEAFSSLGIFIWQVILLLALSFGLTNTLLASVFERVPEIGLLQALGMGRAGVIAQVVLESTVIVMIGLILGLSAGVACVLLLADGIDLSRWAAGTELFGFGRRLAPDLRPRDVHAAVLLVLALALVGSLYPAWHAARISPLEALGRRGYGP